jgi:hypothetical protein
MNELAERTTGYLHPAYALSLSEFGTPRVLRQSGGSILERPIPGFRYRDAMGCYPLFCCGDWSKLQADLAAVELELVSLALVTDPFGNYDVPLLKTSFDRVVPFKSHFVIDLQSPFEASITKHHRYYARKATNEVAVEYCDDPSKFIDEWLELYSNLIQRHSLRGLKALSRVSLLKQLDVPGIVMFRALYRGQTVGAHLWYVQGDIAYSHLQATNSAGYRLGAAYALYWHSIHWFAGGLRWLDLGGDAGTGTKNTGGLSLFKCGWSRTTRIAYFCGRIFQPAEYLEISDAACRERTSYFPVYRHGEFD